MRVLVTGGSGFVGKAIVRALLERGHEVFTLSRKAGDTGTRDGKAASRIHGDIAEIASVENACRNMEAVIHLVGIISESRSVRFEKAHVLGTQNVVKAMADCGVKRLVHMSALGTRASAASRYHQTKWAAEESVRSSSLDWTILRPSLIYGPGDHFLSLFARISKYSPFLPVIGPGTAKFSPVHVDVVAKAFVTALCLEQTFRRSFDLCGPEFLTIPDMLRTLMEAKGTRRLLLHLPVGLARFQALLMETLLGRILNIPPPLNRDQIIMLAEGNTADCSPANEMFRLIHPRFAEAMKESFQGHRVPLHVGPVLL